jgi:hypothetical protein
LVLSLFCILEKYQYTIFVALLGYTALVASVFGILFTAVDFCMCSLDVQLGFSLS